MKTTRAAGFSLGAAHLEVILPRDSLGHDLTAEHPEIM